MNNDDSNLYFISANFSIHVLSACNKPMMVASGSLSLIFKNFMTTTSCCAIINTAKQSYSPRIILTIADCSILFFC